MRLRGAAGWSIAPLGMGAALAAHEALRVLAVLGLGAHAFGEHAHTAVGPALFVELSLGLCVLGAAVRTVLEGVSHPERLGSVPVRSSCEDAALATASIASLAAATLFGMEFVESPSTVAGLGWIGGGLFPGALVLALSATAATGLLHATLRGKVGGFARLAILYAAAFARLAGLRAGLASAPEAIPRGLQIPVRTAPSSRHAGLRAPPTSA